MQERVVILKGEKKKGSRERDGKELLTFTYILGGARLVIKQIISLHQHFQQTTCLLPTEVYNPGITLDSWLDKTAYQLVDQTHKKQ